MVSGMVYLERLSPRGSVSCLTCDVLSSLHVFVLLLLLINEGNKIRFNWALSLLWDLTDLVLTCHWKPPGDKAVAMLFQHVHRAIRLLLLLETGWTRLTSLICKLAACISVVVMSTESKELQGDLVASL